MKRLSLAWIRLQPEAGLAFPGATVLLRDARAEEPEVEGDPRQTSAFVRRFLRVPATPDEVARWYGRELEVRGWALRRDEPGHPQHWREWGRANLRFSLFIYDASPFDADWKGIPRQDQFRPGETVLQTFLEGRAAGFPEDRRQ